jgi:GTP-binding protein
LIDARVGPKDNDFDALNLLDQAAVPTQVVLTKVDKVKAKHLATLTERLMPEIAKRAAAADDIVPVSALKGTGISDLRGRLGVLAAPK